MREPLEEKFLSALLGFVRSQAWKFSTSRTLDQLFVSGEKLFAQPLPAPVPTTAQNSARSLVKPDLEAQRPLSATVASSLTYFQTTNRRSPIGFGLFPLHLSRLRSLLRRPPVRYIMTPDPLRPPAEAATHRGGMVLKYGSHPARLRLPWVESPFFEAELASRADVSKDARSRARSFREDGYLVLRGSVDPELASRVPAETERLFDPGADVRDKACAFRVEDAWRDSEATRMIAAAPAVLSTLQLLYERPAIPFQTLTFRRGSEQRAHLDSFVFASHPERFVCGAFVALEDCDEENGTFFVHPGSHRFTELRTETLAAILHPDDFLEGRFQRTVEALMDAMGSPQHPVMLSAGDVVLFASHLAHGGMPRRNPNRSRWSQVTHYTFTGCFLYVPIHSNPLSGELALRPVIDVRTGEHVPMTCDGVPLIVTAAAGRRVRVELEPAERRRAELRSAAIEAMDGPAGHVRVPAAARVPEPGNIPDEEDPTVRLNIDALDLVPPLLSIQGWAFAAGSQALASSYFLVLRSSGRVAAYPALSIDRPDVAGAHALECARVGYEAVVDTRELPEGRYEIGVLLVFSDRGSSLRFTSRAIDL